MIASAFGRKRQLNAQNNKTTHIKPLQFGKHSDTVYSVKVHSMQAMPWSISLGPTVIESWENKVDQDKCQMLDG